MKIICVGKNYTDHIKEFDGVIPKEMVLFMKPDTALHNLEIPYYIPDFTHNLHHEIEVVLKINQNGKCIAEKYAHKYYDEIALGIDFTARDLQQTLREESLSWEKAKAFDGSAIVGTFVPKTELPELNHLSFRLENNYSRSLSLFHPPQRRPYLHRHPKRRSPSTSRRHLRSLFRREI